MNGAGIYGSQGWVKFGEGDDANGKIKSLPTGMLGRKQADFKFGADDFRFTAGKDGSLYAYCLTVPKPGERLKIMSLGNRAGLLDQPIKSISLLGSLEKIEWQQNAKALELKCPAAMPFLYVVGFKIEI